MGATGDDGLQQRTAWLSEKHTEMKEVLGADINSGLRYQVGLNTGAIGKIDETIGNALSTLTDKYVASSAFNTYKGTINTKFDGYSTTSYNNLTYATPANIDTKIGALKIGALSTRVTTLEGRETKPVDVGSITTGAKGGQPRRGLVNPLRGQPSP